MHTVCHFESSVKVKNTVHIVTMLCHGIDHYVVNIDVFTAIVKIIMNIDKL